MKTPIDHLKNGWKLIWDEYNIGKTEQWYLGLPEGAVNTVVPSFVHMYLPGCFGVSWYEKHLTTELSADKNHILMLRFTKADFITELYINGKFIGRHIGSEDPFEFDVSDHIKAGMDNLISIRISKPHSADVDGFSFLEIPHRNQRPNDLLPGSCYNTYGIDGPLDLVQLPKLYISDSFIFGNTETETVDIEYTIINCAADPVNTILKTECSIKRTGQFENEDVFEFTAQPGENIIKRNIPLEDILIWDITDPNLYNINMSVSSQFGTHRSYKHTGFRTFEVGNDGFFYLNGKRMFLRCTHTGNCMPESTVNLTRFPDFIRRDLVMAKSSGFNAVRFIAGAALQEQLDFCDELGLMAYEEPLSSWIQCNGSHSKELYQNDLFSLIKRDRSHPSLTIWGFLNETYATPPYDDCCYIARDSLKEARELDPTRLVIYSSGRWDSNATVGSYSNPFSDQWQYGWNKEAPDSTVTKEETEHLPYGFFDDESAGENTLMRNAADPEMPFGFHRMMGDVHIYPKYPHTKKVMDIIRTVGCDVKRPVLVSEYGVGSLFNVLWLCRKYEEIGASREMPDVKMVYQMAETYLAELKKYGFDKQYPFPVDMLRESEALHCSQRMVAFNLIRSNPYINGFSVTGMLDHSICGEGLWTFMREWKPGIADTLQSGFAELKWCLFTSDSHIYSGREFEIEGVLANDGVLKARKYDISIKITNGSKTVYHEDITIDVTEDMLKVMSIPVFKRALSIILPTGTYELRAEILEGAAAHDGSLKFYVTDPADISTELTNAVVCGVNERTLSLLKCKGIAITELEDADVDSETVILLGDMENVDKCAAWKKLTRMIKNGSHAFAASRYAFVNGRDYNFYLPMESKPNNTPNVKDSTDWLYHKEYIAKHGSGYFYGLPTGMMDWQYYMLVISGHFFDCPENAVPQEVHSASFGTGTIVEGGYDGGLMLGTYKLGGGTLTVCSYNLIENTGINPAADRMIINGLNMEHRRIKGDSK